MARNRRSRCGRVVGVGWREGPKANLARVLHMPPTSPTLFPPQPTTTTGLTIINQSLNHLT
ncbi:hypothetical protein COLO4_17343 [Corchorus olitorius]|uniref:Uncharacterized protein n=1 Tax=Corchorus olitorius TaxID=93759 RepID=A0A1R3JD48_9ROSI|nr:hypothetical protein COLO4_17343 [Corchorus olitorius]